MSEPINYKVDHNGGGESENPKDYPSNELMDEESSKKVEAATAKPGASSVGAESSSAARIRKKSGSRTSKRIREGPRVATMDSLDATSGTQGSTYKVSEQEPAAIRPGTVTSIRGDSRVSRKIRASITSSSVAASSLMTSAAADMPGPEEPAAIRPGTVTSVRGDSRVAGKIRASMTASKASAAAAASDMQGPEEPAAIRPGTVTSVSGDSRVSRKIRASMTTSMGSAAAAASDMPGPEEPAAIRPGSVTSVSGDSRVSRKIRASMTSTTASAAAAMPLSEEPEAMSPGTVTMVQGDDSRVSQKIRSSMTSMSISQPSSDVAMANGDARASRTVRSSQITAMTSAIAEDIEGFNDEEPDQDVLPGTTASSSMSYEERLARKMQASSNVGASAQTDDSKVQGKARRGRRSVTSTSKVGAVQSTGEDIAQQKTSWVSDNLFKNEEGKQIDETDYLRQQVEATKESKIEKDKKKKVKGMGKNGEDKLQKDGASAVPKTPGAFSVQGGRGWFTGGFRMRSRLKSKKSYKSVVHDTGIDLVLQEEIDEEQHWDKTTWSIGLCIVIIIIVCVTVPVTISTTSDAAPTLSPTSSRYFLIDDFQTSLSALSDPQSFMANTAQRDALDWLVYEDPMGVMPEEPLANSRYILMDIYYGNGGKNWKFTNENHGWGSGKSICDWEGVGCDDRNNAQVNALYLYNFGLTGTLQSELLHLSDMTSLDLSGNNLDYSEFPTMLLEMTQLKELFFDENALRGSIPNTISKLVYLQKLSLISNELTGPLPSEIWTLSDLKVFRASGNNLRGDLFENVDKWPKLEKLILDNNQFSGTIPTEIGMQRSLSTLRLERNELKGSIPTELGLLSELSSLTLSQQNMITGAIPSEIGQCNKLTRLHLDFNLLGDSLPTEVGVLKSIEDIRLTSNNLMGNIPSQLGYCTKLKTLALNINDFSGTVPSELGSLVELQSLLLIKNKMSGAIPTEICDLKANELSGDCSQCVPKTCCTLQSVC